MKAVVSFVHGYERPDFPVSAGPKAALCVVEAGEVHEVVQVEFLRTPSDFQSAQLPIVGEEPVAQEDFQALPRFGITGLHRHESVLYAGSWNGIYLFDSETLELQSFVTNRLTADIHGLYATHGQITTTIPSIDGVVQTDMSGNILGAFVVGADLSISELDPTEEPDWRFAGKQMRGPLGAFHFNAVEVEEGRIWLTSRNLGCYVSFVPGDSAARLHSIAHMTPVMMHDGVPFGDSRYATSVDGKILVHSASDWASVESYSKFVSGPSAPSFQTGIFALSESVIRVDDILGRQTNWCRGLEVGSDSIVSTVDGRYGSGAKFGIVELSGTQELVAEATVLWKDVGDPTGLRYVTGFDVSEI